MLSELNCIRLDGSIVSREGKRGQVTLLTSFGDGPRLQGRLKARARCPCHTDESKGTWRLRHSRTLASSCGRRKRGWESF